MRIFLTGASGIYRLAYSSGATGVGSSGYRPARSDATAQALEAAGVEASRHAGCPDSLLAGVERADAVIHTAFDHDFSRFAANCEKDRQRS